MSDTKQGDRARERMGDCIVIQLGADPLDGRFVAACVSFPGVISRPMTAAGWDQMMRVLEAIKPGIVG